MAALADQSCFEHTWKPKKTYLNNPDTQKKNAPKVGDSHFRDRDGKVLPEASAARHNCVQCHVPQVDAPPLVENDFKGDIVAAKPAGKKKN